MNLPIIERHISLRKKRVFSIILDQCLPSLRLQLEGAKTFEETCEKNDNVELLK